MARAAVVLFDQSDGRELISKYCKKINLPMADLKEMLKAVIDMNAMERRRGLWKVFDEILDQRDTSAEQGDVPEAD